MKAIVITKPGGPEVLELRTVPDPVPGPEEILVAVRATALNRADLLQRRGRYPAPPGCPADIPGLEFAGVVETCGQGTSLFRPGDRVMGLLGGGGYAEKVVVHEGCCLPVPADRDFTGAAAFPEAFLTAYDALFARGGLAAGEILLVHAAASGVGTAAIQIAHLAGARAIATSRTEDKRRRLAGMAGCTVLDPAVPDLAERIRNATGERGVNVVLELLGASTWDLDLSVLAERGRIVVVGTMTGSAVSLDLSTLMRRRATVIGTVLRGRPMEEKIALVRSFAGWAASCPGAARLAAVVDRVLPFERASEAHALMERNENFGKIVLAWGGAA